MNIICNTNSTTGSRVRFTHPGGVGQDSLFQYRRLIEMLPKLYSLQSKQITRRLVLPHKTEPTRNFHVPPQQLLTVPSLCSGYAQSHAIITSVECHLTKQPFANGATKSRRSKIRDSHAYRHVLIFAEYCY